jgi:membrane protein DedA with SNARE-associated domain
MLQWLYSSLTQNIDYGYWALFTLVFLKSVGVPVPGDTALLGAGFILGKFGLSLWQAMAVGTAAAFFGGQLGFGLGGRIGHSRLREIKWLHLTPERVEWVERFFKRHEANAVLAARFIALLPTLAICLLAGMAKMPPRRFLFYNLAGSTVYAAGYVLTGNLLWKNWEFLESWLGPGVFYVVLAVIAFIVLSVIFSHYLSQLLLHFFQNKRNGKK